jgi:hypothetical protein
VQYEQPIFYVQLKFTPRIRTYTVPMTKQHGAVVEVPKDLVQRKEAEIMNENPREKVIVLDLARRGALGAFPTVEERGVGLYHEDQPIWYEDRPHVMMSAHATTKKMAPKRGGSLRESEG